MNEKAKGNAFRLGKRLPAKMLLYMKLTAFFLLVACLHVQAKTFSQKVSISGKNLSLEKVFDMVKTQTGYDVLYNPDLLKKTKPVSISVKDVELQTALDLCFRDQPVSFLIRYNTIVVTTKAKEIVAENKEIHKPDPIPVPINGKVSSETGESLAGVSIVVKRSNKGTTTNDKGNFTIDVNSGDVLVISMIGHVPQEI